MPTPIVPRPITEKATTTAARPANWSELLVAAREGDDDALGEICQKFYKHLLLTADQGLGGDIRAKFGASDVVQQSMLEAQNDFCGFVGESEQEFRRWITRLVERNLIDSVRQFRKTKRRDISREIPIEPSGASHSPARQPLLSKEETASRIVRRQEEDQELAEAVNRLSHRQQQVIELRHRQALSYSEIADRLEISEAATRKLWSRAVEQLRHHLVGHHEHRPNQPR